MEEILSDIKSGRWWFSTVFVAIIVSLVANIMYDLLIKNYKTKICGSQKGSKKILFILFICINILTGYIAGLVVANYHSSYSLFFLPQTNIKIFLSYEGILLNYLIIFNISLITMLSDDDLLVKTRIYIITNSCLFICLFFSRALPAEAQILCLFIAGSFATFFCFFIEEIYGEPINNTIGIQKFSIALSVLYFAAPVVCIDILMAGNILNNYSFYANFAITGGIIGFLYSIPAIMILNHMP